MNFGLPGGLSAPTLYKQMRMQGLEVTLDEVAEIRDTWFDVRITVRIVWCG